MVTAKRLITGSALTTTAATYYTVPAATTTILKELQLCNTDTTVGTVTAYILPSGATTTTVAATILSAMSVQSGETKIFSLSSVMSSGVYLQALASVASKISINASGTEIT